MPESKHKNSVKTSRDRDGYRILPEELVKQKPRKPRGKAPSLLTVIPITLECLCGDRYLKKLRKCPRCGELTPGWVINKFLESRGSS